MSSLIRLSFIFMIIVVGIPASAGAQAPPPPIGRIVVDGRGVVAIFQKEPQLAASHGLTVEEMPGPGLGIEGGAHVYLFTWKAVTVGLGAQFTLARSHATPAEGTSLRAVTERFIAFTPQFSLNFGTGNGWSYLSGGLGSARLTLVPDGAEETAVDQTALRTLNYGGGARWFIKPRLAFTLDVRFHQLDPGTPQLGLPATPRMTFMIIGAGVSLKAW